MALLRKLFYRKPPDGLLEICERVYVFDYCFSTDVWEEANYKDYIGGVIRQLRDHYPDVSILVFNFREGQSASQIAIALSEHDLTIMDYPRHYEGCPLLPMEVIHHFLRSSESWLSLGQQNVLLMHCERGGWPVLAFMLAALLLYRKHYSGEHKTLDMVYKQAPRELLHCLSPLNPVPSQLRYLQYISRRNLVSEWPPLDRALSLDCIIIRMIPKFDGDGGCRPIFRIYGQDPCNEADRTPKILFSTPKKSKAVRHYKQAECELVKIDINCRIQGDVVLECISLNDDMDREQMMFRAMFNTAFIRSNILILNRDEIDIFWDAKDQFPKDFRAEVLFSEIDAATSVVLTDFTCFEEKDGLPLEAFGKVHEIFNSVDWLLPNADTLDVIQQVNASNAVQGKLASDAHQNMETSSWVKGKIFEKLLDRERYAALGRDDKSSMFSALKDESCRSPKSSSGANMHEETTESQHMETKRLLNRKQTSPRFPASELSPTSPSKNSDVAGEPSSPFPPDNLLKEGPIHSSLQKDSTTYWRISAEAIVVPSDSGSENSDFESSPSTQSIASPLSPKDLLIGFVRSQSPSPIPLRPNTPVMDKVDDKSSPPPPPPPPQRLTTDKPVSAPSPLLIHPSPATSKKNENAKGSDSPSTNLTGNAAYTSMPSLPLPRLPPPTMTDATLRPDVLDLKSKPPAPPLPPATPLEENTAMRGGPSIRTSPPTAPPKEASPFEGGKVPPPPLPLPPPKEIEGASIFKGGEVPPPPPPLPPAKEIEISGDRIPPPPPLPPAKEIDIAGGRTPPPPPPLPPAKEVEISGGKTPPPPPPPPLPSGPFVVPTNSSVVPPPPPPPLHSGPVAVFNTSVAPPPPPPPMMSAKPTVPSVPPPPLPPKENHKAGIGPTNYSSAPLSPAPPSAPPPVGKGKPISSRTMASKNSQGKKLKPLHWLKFTRAVQGSLWAETQKSGEVSKTPEIDVSELESLFSAAVPNSDKGGSGRKGSSQTSLGQKPEKVQLIEHRRAYNCEIMLSKVKIPLPDLLSSVLALEDSAMDVDQVENLIKFCPTKEEMELLKGYKGEKDKLGKCEQFFLELMQVPRIEAKLRVFSFKIQFQSQVSELRNNLNIINSAADQIRSSSKLKRIMQTILSLGNALNQGTARGSAVGFRLDSLLKLTETRARNNKMTLMHYLCKVLADNTPDLLDFSKDISSLQLASKIQLKFLAEEMQTISKGLEKVVQELSISENDGPVSENFRKELKEFLSFAEGEVRSLASLYSGVGRNVDKLILYFGEDPSRCPFEQVTSTLINFVRMFDKAHQENCKQLEFEKKKAEKEAAAEKAKKMKLNASEENAVKPKMHALQETTEKQKSKASEKKSEKQKMCVLEEKMEKLKKRPSDEMVEKPKMNTSDRIMSI